VRTAWTRRVLLPATTAAALVMTTAGPASAAVQDVPQTTASFNGRVSDLVYAGDTVYVGGDFTSARGLNGKSYPRNRLAAIDARTGELLPWAPSANGVVRAVAFSGGKVYIGGSFTEVHGTARARLTRIDASTGRLESVFRPSVNRPVHDLITGNGRLYAGGEFTSVNSATRTRLAAFQLSDGALDAGWRPSASNTVEGLAATSKRVYVVGRFTELNGSTARAYAAAVNPVTGATDSSFAARLAYNAGDVHVHSTGVYVAADGPGGHLRAYGFDGRSRWDLTTDGGVQAVTEIDGDLYIGGHFDNVCRSTRTGDNGSCLDGKVQRKKLARVTTSGTLVEGWSPQANSALGVLTLEANPNLGRIAAGGDFTTFKFGKISQPKFAQFTR